jgi:hypothetical protein
MKPLPALNSTVTRPTESVMPHLPSGLTSTAPSYSSANRRASACATQRAYPWLLAASTGLAAAFCLMYITKPVIRTSAGSAEETAAADSATTEKATKLAKASMLPDRNRLPGETGPSDASAAAPTNALPANPFEQTNIRVQHILTAEAPGGQLAKIDIDVPVLYQSRALRWTPAEVADARDLLTRLTAYQEKSRALRDEGAELLGAWNQLVERSIPSAQLRADSPTLPANQQDAVDSARPALLDTADSIQIKTAGK